MPDDMWELRPCDRTWDAEDGRSRYTQSGRPRASRAAQFMPFAALTGYYQLVREQERVVEERHRLNEEEAAALSATLVAARRGDRLRVVHYDPNGYLERTGTVEEVDQVDRVLRLSDARIPFDDIRAAEIIEPETE